MERVLFSRPCIILTQINLNRIEKHFRRNFKTKTAKNTKQKVTNSDRALEHFDLHYRPVYKKKWPSIRIALLTAKKTCAVINSSTDNREHIERFVSDGAYDIIQAAFTEQQRRLENNTEKVSSGAEKGSEEIRRPRDEDQVQQRLSDAVGLTLENESEDINDETSAFKKVDGVISQDEADGTDLDRTDLYKFRPTETVYSESQELRIEEAKRSVYTPMDVKVDIEKPRKITLPSDLKVLGFPSGNVTTFPDVEPDKTNGYFCFYFLDAASLLPVIALDLEKGDNVLDLCAAPGGKSLSILQTGLAGSLTCNDLSGSRNARLFNILRLYLPEEKRQHVTVTRRNGISYDQPIYDKVLVDVPCNTDRHVLSVDDNNLFSPPRIKERIEMPTLQKDLLLSGIKSCRPGGCVVYSTCTLSPAQNDGVVQNALDDLWKNTNIDVVVEDLEEIQHIFKDTFNFFNTSRFGQLVIPSLSLNYGPMYFCRLRRIS